MERKYNVPGEGRPPFGKLQLDDVKQALMLLTKAHTAWYNGQIALLNLKMAIAQRLIDQALHLEQQVYATTDLPTKIDLTHQVDLLAAKVVAILYDFERGNDDTLSSTN